MTVQELIDFLTDLNEPDMKVVMLNSGYEDHFLQSRHIGIQDNDYSHAMNEKGEYVLTGRVLVL